MIFVKSDLLTDEEKNLIISKKQSKRVIIGIYLKEWDLSLSSIYGTENEKEGKLSDALSKFFDLCKPGRFLTKADLMIGYKNMQIPIELTTATISKKRNNIKNFEILSRFYFGLKWCIENPSPFFIILDETWKKSKWISREALYVKNKNIYVIYVKFKKGWENEVAKRIFKILNKLSTK